MTTPMMQQYLDAKARHPGMILLFRMGDFYETFDSDAELVSRILGLTLTSRDKSMPMAGFPHHQLESYLRKLLHSGHRVAVCDQVEDPAMAKGIVKREVTRVVTPGTITEDELLDPRKPNHLLSLLPGKTAFGLAWMDPSTGEFLACDVQTDHLGDELQRINASECLIADGKLSGLLDEMQSLLPRTVSRRPDWTFDARNAREALQEQFGTSTFTGFGFDDAQPCLTAAGALLLYLRETLKSNLAHLRKLRPFTRENCLTLDEVTRRSLELTRTLRDASREGSLLSMLDRTVTPMGARLLHDSLLAPLARRDEIEARLDGVQELLNDHTLRMDLRGLLQESYDLPRLTTRISTGRATPRDLTAVAKTLRLLPKFKARVSGRKALILAELERRIELCPDLREALDHALVEEPPANVKDGGVIRAGYSAELDDLRKLASEGKNWIARYQAQEITRTNIPSLKVGFNSVFGYYIEITNVHTAKVPSDYIRKQTLKNAERYITPELKEYEEKVLTAQEKSLALEAELFTRLREQIAAQTHRLLSTADVLAMIDFLAALAELASSRQYVRPLLSEEPILEVREGRHPVLDQMLPPGTFVPNDSVLSPSEGNFWLITGPNMAGKSTFIRQVALITLMSHVGSFVPAKLARVGITDRIFTRVGASDELNRGLSTFMVEMTEAANILNNATSRSLVILDEIGRGTSTYDGVSLAWSIVEHLHDEVRCRALFATHYHELAQLAETLPGLKNYNVQVEERDQKILFLHRIAPGNAERSYGIHVARLAGVPESILQRASSILKELEARHQLTGGKKPKLVLPPEGRRRKKLEENGPNLLGESS
jgi:DNA mismatch repair protein MutS